MRWARPFVVHGAALLDEEDLVSTGKTYQGWLHGLSERSSRARAA